MNKKIESLANLQRRYRKERIKKNEIQEELSEMKTFDDILSGLKPGKLTLVASPVSVGKSFFALNMVEDIILNDERVLWVTLEQTRVAFFKRVNNLFSGKVTHNMQEIDLSNFLVATLIDQDYEKDLEEMLSEYKPKILVTDYIQLLDSSSRILGMGSIVRRLKSLALKHNIPVIAVSQVSRTYKNGNHNTGGLQVVTPHVDQIVLLNRETEDFDLNPPFLTDIIISKNKSGKTGQFTMKFEPEKAIFY